MRKRRSNRRGRGLHKQAVTRLASARAVKADGTRVRASSQVPRTQAVTNLTRTDLERLTELGVQVTVEATEPRAGYLQAVRRADYTL
jgi:hypothetical protein